MADIENGWRYCKNCRILYWGGDNTQGVCANGGEHDHNNQEYSVYRNQVPLFGEEGWRFCQLCMGLFWRERADSHGKCVATTSNHRWNGDKYAVLLGGTGRVEAEGKWAYCLKCGAFFYNGYANKGDCASGGEHKSNGAEYYAIETLNLSKEVIFEDPNPPPIPDEDRQKHDKGDPFHTGKEPSKDDGGGGRGRGPMDDRGGGRIGGRGGN